MPNHGKKGALSKESIENTIARVTSKKAE